ncbi:MAG: hypothetical protein L0154_15960, partial [Chloroflexi bacterium]|nr:hypothetical protein [Chloroflexota bacterium]
MFNRDILEREYARSANTGETLKRLGSYFSPYRNLLIGVLVLVIVTTLLQLAPPWFIGQAIDCYIAPNFGQGSASCVFVD